MIHFYENQRFFVICTWGMKMIHFYENQRFFVIYLGEEDDTFL